MPHKVNSRSCERINGLRAVLAGYLTMASELAGDQWNEGDVSCSVVRRVALPGAMFAIDGLLETFATVVARDGGVPGGGRRRARAGGAVPRHHHRAHGGGEARRRTRGGARGDQGACAGGRARDARGTAQAGDLLARLGGGPAHRAVAAPSSTRALALDERFVGAALAQADAFRRRRSSSLRRSGFRSRGGLSARRQIL